MTSNKIRHFYTLSPYITQYLKNKSSCDITIIIHSSTNRSKNSTELNASQCSDVNTVNTVTNTAFNLSHIVTFENIFLMRVCLRTNERLF